MEKFKSILLDKEVLSGIGMMILGLVALKWFIPENIYWTIITIFGVIIGAAVLYGIWDHIKFRRDKKNFRQEHLQYTIIDSIYKKYGKGKDKDIEDFALLTKEEQVVLYTTAFIDEVSNGGYEQYFTNPTGDFANETIGALKTVGAPIESKNLQKVIIYFYPDGKSDIDSEERLKVFQKKEKEVGEDAIVDFIESLEVDLDKLRGLLQQYIDQNKKVLLQSKK